MLLLYDRLPLLLRLFLGRRATLEVLLLLRDRNSSALTQFTHKHAHLLRGRSGELDALDGLGRLALARRRSATKGAVEEVERAMAILDRKSVV